MSAEHLYAAAAILLGLVVAVLAGVTANRDRQAQRAENAATDAKLEATHAEAKLKAARESDQQLTADLRADFLRKRDRDR